MSMTTSDDPTDPSGHIPRPMKTTEEHIAQLEKRADEYLRYGSGGRSLEDTTMAIAYELRALRLMLRDELREAAWRVKSS